MSIAFYQENSQFVEVVGLQDQAARTSPTDPPVYVNSGVGSGTLMDPSGVAVTGASNIVGQYVSGSDGIWRFPVDPDTFHPAIESGYKFVIEITATSGAVYKSTLSAKVKLRSKGTEL